MAQGNITAKIIALTTMTVIAGCAAPPPMTAAQVKQMEPPVCTSQSQCTVMWQRAQLWLVNNSSYRIQTANDTLLQTYGPGNSSPSLAYTITREPVANGGYKIVMRAACDNFLGCIPTSAGESVIEFNNHLRQFAVAP